MIFETRVSFWGIKNWKSSVKQSELSFSQSSINYLSQTTKNRVFQDLSSGASSFWAFLKLLAFMHLGGLTIQT